MALTARLPRSDPRASCSLQQIGNQLVIDLLVFGHLFSLPTLSQLARDDHLHKISYTLIAGHHYAFTEITRIIVLSFIFVPEHTTSTEVTRKTSKVIE